MSIMSIQPISYIEVQKMFHDFSVMFMCLDAGFEWKLSCDYVALLPVCKNCLQKQLLKHFQYLKYKGKQDLYMYQCLKLMLFLQCRNSIFSLKYLPDAWEKENQIGGCMLSHMQLLVTNKRFISLLHIFQNAKFFKYLTMAQWLIKKIYFNNSNKEKYTDMYEIKYC